jgi:LPXTG-site transpeptidase (sortase) family protein
MIDFIVKPTQRRRGLRVLASVLMLASILFNVAPVYAVNYIDDFDPDPLGAGVSEEVVETGTTDTGMTYTFTAAGGGGDFGIYENKLDLLSFDDLDSTTELITIVSRDGKAFVFNSMWIDINISTYGSGFTITGIGPEPFAISTGGPGTIDTYSPSGGAKLVTEVTISSVDFYSDWIDNVDVELDVPGMDVQGNSSRIVNGDSTPASADDTNMGSVTVGASSSSTFTIRSIGDASLDLTGSPYVTVSDTTNFSVTTQPTTDPISSGGSDTFSVQCSPASSGSKTATVTINNNSEASPYTFDVACTGTGPEIDVQRPAGTSIPDGGTDAQGSLPAGAVNRTYTVANSGTSTLNVTNITSANASNVTVNSIFPTNLTVAAGGGTATFDVQFTPTTDGAFSFDLDITSDDADEGNYDIAVSGTRDADPPGLTSFTRQTPASSPTNVNSLVFRAAFDEDVSGVDTSDFAVSGTTASIGLATIDAHTYDLTLSGGDLAGLTGTVGVDLAGGQNITDLAGNALPAGEPATDETYTLDNTAPGISIGAPSTTDTSSGPVSYTVTYSGADTIDLQAGDITLSTTGTATGTVMVNNGTTMTPTVTISGISGDGTLGISVAAGQASDAAGNTDEGAGPSATFNVDNSAPGISISAPSTTDTKNGPVSYTVTYSGADTIDLQTGDITLNTTGTATGTVGVSNGTTSTPTVTISGISGNGTLGISVAAGQASDTAGNTDAGAGPSATFNVDNTGPTVTINEAASQADPTNLSPIHFTVVFSEPVTGFAAGDVTLSGTAGAALATVTEIAPNDGTTYNVAASGMTADGTVTATIGAGGTLDAVGNGNAASTSTDNTVTFDGSPEIDIQRPVGTSIFDGGSDTLGNQTLGTVNLTYTVSNTTGSDILTITGVSAVNLTNVSNFSLDTTTPINVAGGTTATFDVSFNVGVNGPFGFDMDIFNNDADETNYDIAISGTGTGGVPEIDMQRPAGTSIPDGGVDAIGMPGVGIVNLTYTIDNSGGTAPLTISGYLAANENNVSGFFVTTPLPINVPAGGTGSAVITFNVDAAGPFSFDMDVANDDSDENPYNIRVSGVAADLVVVQAGNTSPLDGEELTAGPSTMGVQFNKEVITGGAGVAGAADNPSNYLLLEDGPSNNGFDTVSCAGGVVADDVRILVDSVSYNNGTFTATLSINGGTALPTGSYRLLVCGTTSIEDLFGNELNGGLADTLINFTVVQDVSSATVLPATGFAPGQVTKLPAQSASLIYANTAMVLEIPSLGQLITIMSVPQTGNSWNVTWLGANAGYLSGTAFPTWAGNTVLTGHVWDAFNQPGPFADLKSLQHGDQFYIHAFGMMYVYEVRENTLLRPTRVDKALQHEEYDWVTLLTCEGFDAAGDGYGYRRIVRAVLVSVE